MKSFTFAALLAVTNAQQGKIVEASNPIPISEIEVDDLIAMGSISEARAIYDEAGSEIDQVLLAVGF